MVKILFLAPSLENTGASLAFVDLMIHWKLKPKFKDVRFSLFLSNKTIVDSGLIRTLEENGIKCSTGEQPNFSVADILVVNTSWTPYYAQMFDAINRNKLRKAFIYGHEYRLTMDDTVKKRLAYYARRNFIGFYAPTQQAAENYASDLRIAAKSIKVMPGRVQISSDEIFSREPNEFDTIDFIVAGYATINKGHLDIVWAFIEFQNTFLKKQARRYRDFRLIILGLAEFNGDYFDKRWLYSERIHSAAKLLGDKIELHNHAGHKSTLEYIKKANVTILFSQYECLPGVIFEGEAYGHPIIRSRVGGLDEQYDGNGFLVDASDINTLTSVIETMLNKVKITNRQLSDMSRKSNEIARKYTVAQYDVIINDVSLLL
jgi:glycosyltransferase involved in cell wall biosynthesis